MNQNYNLKKEINIDELKSIQLDILNEIDIFCKKHQIKYFLTGGTLLGAIRHKGFIPWDDDIDIAMFRDDYNRFVNEFKSVSGCMDVLSIYSQQNYVYLFAKVINNKTILFEDNYTDFPIGVYVDVFPIDALFDSKRKCIFWVRFISFLRLLYILKFLKIRRERVLLKNMVIASIGLICKIIPKKNFLLFIDRLNQLFKKHTKSYYVANLCGAWGTKEISCRDNFLTTIEAEFEGRRYPIPQGYEYILKDLYGNYKELPPLEKQVSHHHFKAYYK